MVGLQNPNLTFEELYEEAKRAEPLLKEQGSGIISDLRRQYPGLFDTAYFEQGPLKTLERAQDKVRGDYKNDHSKIADLTRGRIVVENAQQVEILRDYFKQEREGFKTEVSKDRFAKPSDTNFRDINMQVRMANGHVVEMRVEQKDLIAAAKNTHDPYEEVQKIERAAKSENRLMTNDEAVQRQRILDTIRDIHGEPVSKVGLDSLLSDEGRAKVSTMEAERITPRNDNSRSHKSSQAMEHGAGKAAGAAGIAVDIASGNYGAAALGVATEAATSKTALELAEKSAATVAGSLLKNVVKRIPLVGAAVTAGFVAIEVGEHLVNGDGKKALAAAAAGGAEVAGNVVGFGVGDAAREAVREGIIATGGKEYEGIEKSGLRQLGETGVGLMASAFNRSAPGTPEQISQTQSNLLAKSGLQTIERDGKPVDVSRILSNPEQRQDFIKNLETSIQVAATPEVKKDVGVMLRASQDFVALEDKRLTLTEASNEPVFGVSSLAMVQRFTV